MRLIVLASSYRQFTNFVHEAFPHVSGPAITQMFAVVTDERDIEKLYGLMRGTMFVNLGGTGIMLDVCRARFNEIRFVDHG